MFDPCNGCKGIDRSGWGNDECGDCRLTELKYEVDSLKVKIKNELEPRIASERMAYDSYVTNPER